MNRLLLLLVFLLASSIIYSQPEPIRVLQHNEEYPDFDIKGLQFSNDGKLLISAAEKIKIWNVANWDLEKEYGHYTDNFCLSNDNEYMVFTTGGTSVYLFDVNAEEVIHTFQGHPQALGLRLEIPNFIRYITISDNNKYLATVGNEQQTIIWDVTTKEKLINIGNVNMPKFSPGNNFLAMAFNIYSVPELMNVFKLQDSQVDVDDFAFNQFSYNGQLYITASNNGYLRIWDWDTKSLNDRIKLYNSSYNMDISNDQKYIITAGSDKIIQFYDIENRHITLSFELNELDHGFLPLVSIHPEEDIFAISGPNGKIYIYNFQEVLASQSGVVDWEGYE